MAEADTPPVQLTEEAEKLISEISKGENIYNAEVEVSEASAKGENYMGQLFRVRVTDGNRQKVKSFIVKCAPNAKVMREAMPVELVYQRETDAYEKVLPTLYDLQEKRNVPNKERFLYAKHYGSIRKVERETIVLEDLCFLGYKMYNRKIPFDQQHLELVIRTLARFHATSFVLQRTDPEKFKEVTKVVSTFFDLGENAKIIFDMGKRKCLAIMTDPEIRRRADEQIGDMYEKMKWFVDSKRTDPYNVICHGDCWINNFLFKYENDCVVGMKFVDLQMIRLASPITDLAYMIFSSTDEAIRSSHYERILDLYYETLNLNIGLMGCKASECYPIEVYKDQIKSTMPMAMLAAIMVLPIILCDRENVPDMDRPIEEFDDSMYDKILSDNSKNRMNGVARDCVAYGYM